MELNSPIDIEIQHIIKWTRKYFLENAHSNSKAVIGMSGGKDSTVTALFLVEALGKENVFGVLMPQDVQTDIDDARDICKALDIKYMEVDIGPTCNALYRAIDDGLCKGNSAVTTNTPARVRMATLYAIAAIVGGRVVNTCNYSEDYIGYSTKYGDLAGDFGLLKNYTVSAVKHMGERLAEKYGLNAFYINKRPSDGMCGKTDEDNLGFSYEVLDKYLLEGTAPDYNTLRNIEDRHKRNEHKECIKIPCPSPKNMR